jgi:ABC-type multidrug transport system ATPase subunit
VTIPLQVRGVRRAFRRAFGRPAVIAIAEASFELGVGEIACLIGSTGAGKSTLLALAAGRLRPDAGVVRIEGEPAHAPAARRIVGLAPRDAAFPPGLSVRDVLSYCARCHASGPVRASLVGDMIDLAGLEAVCRRRATELALPDARRLLLALAAMGQRRVVLVDEPFAGLDAVTRRDLGERLQRLSVRGASVLLSSSDPIGLERLVDRVLVLRAGRLVRVSPAAALLGGRVLEVVLDAPPRETPPGFRVTATGIEADLGHQSAEAALALCRSYRLAVRGSRVRLRTLDEAAFGAEDGVAR